MEQDFWHKRKIDHFDPYNASCAIATDILCDLRPLLCSRVTYSVLVLIITTTTLPQCLVDAWTLFIVSMYKYRYIDFERFSLYFYVFFFLNLK